MNFLGSKIFLFLILVGGGFLTSAINASADQQMIELVSLVPTEIKNQKIQQILPGTYLVEWKTNAPTTAKVVYDIISVENQGVDGEYEYNFSTTETKEATTTHKVAVWGLDPARGYYLRPVSFFGDGDNSTVIYGNESVSNAQSAVPGYVQGECNYITEYLKYGENNSFVEVLKLQRFLIDREGYLDILPTGFFDEKTLQRTKEFQMNYKEDVLFPWGIDIPTGYVYVTTTKKINELYCGREFELSQDHLQKMSSFSEIIELMKLPPSSLTDFDSIIPSRYLNEIILDEVGQNNDDILENNNKNITESELNDNVFGNNLDFDYLNENFVDKSFVVDGEIANGKNEEQEGVVFRILSSISSAVRKMLDFF